MKLQVCPNCKKPSLKYDSIFDFWQCQSCNHLYSDGLDDPDYDDDVHQAQEAIADGQEVTWFLKSKVAVK